MHAQHTTLARRTRQWPEAARTGRLSWQSRQGEHRLPAHGYTAPCGLAPRWGGTGWESAACLVRAAAEHVALHVRARARMPAARRGTAQACARCTKGALGGALTPRTSKRRPPVCAQRMRSGPGSRPAPSAGGRAGHARADGARGPPRGHHGDRGAAAAPARPCMHASPASAHTGATCLGQTAQEAAPPGSAAPREHGGHVVRA